MAKFQVQPERKECWKDLSCSRNVWCAVDVHDVFKEARIACGQMQTLFLVVAVSRFRWL